MMKAIRCNAAITVCAAGILTGCIGTRPPDPAMPSLNAAEAMLLDAALRAETAVTRLAALEGNPAGGGDSEDRAGRASETGRFRVDRSG